MFLLFGTRASDTVVNVVQFVCSYCTVAAGQNVVKRANRFTLFFVPLFSFSTSYYVECSNCGGVTNLTKAQADNSLEWSRRRSAA